MKSKAQLDTLVEQFTHWRSTRGQNRKTPCHLAKAALEMSKDYPKTEFLQALGINSHALRRWEKQFSAPSLEPEFVELTGSSNIEPKPESLRLEVQQAGLTLTVSGNSHELADFAIRLTKGERQ